MSQINLLDEIEAATLAGIKQAQDNANRHCQGWSEMAYNYLLNYLSNLTQDDEFTTEQVRQTCPLPAPPTNRAWGAVMLRAKKNNIIKFAGYTRSRQVTCHKSILQLWKPK